MSACVQLFIFVAGCGPEKTAAAHAISARARNLEGVNAAVGDIATNGSWTHISQPSRSFDSKEFDVIFAPRAPDSATGEDWMVRHRCFPAPVR